MPTPTPPPTPRTSPSLLAYIPIDLRIAGGRSWSLAKRSALISAVLLAPILGYACLGQGSGESGWLTLILATLIFDLFYAGAIAITVAVFSVLWRLFGISLIVATVLAPVVFFGLLTLCGPWIVDLGVQMLGQWATAIATHDFAGDPLVKLGAFGHAGHAGLLILLIIILPYMLIWVGEAALLLITPPVLWSLLSLAAASTLVLSVSLFLAIVVAAPLLIIAMIRRLRRRHRDYVAAAEAHPSSATA